MSGRIARKIGMSRVFLPTGEAVAVTYLQIEPNVVVRTKSEEKDGYNAIVLGIGAKPWKSRKGKSNTRYSHQKEWKVPSLDGLSAGAKLILEEFTTDAIVTIQGVTKGKGFQGVMRRHNFAGGPASHGSHFKREPGTIGMRTTPGRVLKGHPMAGRMGGDTMTLQHRSIVAIDSEKGLIAVRGPVPGPQGAIVYVTKEESPSTK
jgi:large subunit ribosomal protein L3